MSGEKKKGNKKRAGEDHSGGRACIRKSSLLYRSLCVVASRLRLAPDGEDPCSVRLFSALYKVQSAVNKRRRDPTKEGKKNTHTQDCVTMDCISDESALA